MLNDEMLQKALLGSRIPKSTVRLTVKRVESETGTLDADYTVVTVVLKRMRTSLIADKGDFSRTQ
jgi:hypothetical protein